MPTSHDGPTYDPAHFAHLFSVEQRHAWFRARNELIGEIASGLVTDAGDGYRVLEVGCGTGGVLRTLEQACARGRVIGMDSFAEGLRFARQRTGCSLVVGDANHPPFGREFSLVGMFDVLEHLPDDRGVLARMGEILLPGGALMLTVPADPALWSYFDEASNHQRRYDAADLRDRLESAGFAVEYVTHFMTALTPMLRTYRRIAGLKSRSPEQAVARDLRIVPVVNDVMYRLLVREQRAIRARKVLSGGTSILAIARRRA